MRNGLGLVLALQLLCSGLPLTVLAAGAVESEAAVEKTLADYRTAWMESDQQTVLDTLSDEIQLFVPGSTDGRVVGKDAVREFWFPGSDRSYPIRGYEISGQEIYVQGDLAVVTGRSKLDWETVEDGEVIDQAVSHSEYITVLRNEDGHWRIFRQMYQMREE